MSANAAHVSRFGVRTPTWNTVLPQVPTGCLQMLHLSADLAYTRVKHCLGTSPNGASANAARVSGFGVHSHETQQLSANLAYTYVTHCLGANTNGVPANTAPVSGGFGVHSRETLSRRKYQQKVCKCSTCKRIWRTPT